MIEAEGRTLQLTPQDLLRLGLANLAYVKARHEGEAVIYAVHAADGTELGTVDDRDVATLALRVGDLLVFEVGLAPHGVIGCLIPDFQNRLAFRA